MLSSPSESKQITPIWLITIVATAITVHADPVENANPNNVSVQWHLATMHHRFMAYSNFERLCFAYNYDGGPKFKANCKISPLPILVSLEPKHWGRIKEIQHISTLC